jgi:enoyl-CoA hydratase/carnithine racemase
VDELVRCVRVEAPAAEEPTGADPAGEAPTGEGAENIRTVLVVEMHRPERLHAMNTALLTALIGELEAAARDPAVDAVVITGSGACFSSGADVSEDLDHAGAVGRMALFTRLFELVTLFPRPTVAAIAGWCVGGGAEIASGCDLRVGTPGASIRFPPAVFGVPVGAARLPALIGLSHAKDLLMTARTIDAEEAYRIGWLNRLVPPEALVATAAGLAALMARHKGSMTQKRILDEVAGLTPKTRQENRGLRRYQGEAEGLMG